VRCRGGQQGESATSGVVEGGVQARQTWVRGLRDGKGGPGPSRAEGATEWERRKLSGRVGREVAVRLAGVLMGGDQDRSGPARAVRSGRGGPQTGWAVARRAARRNGADDGGGISGTCAGEPRGGKDAAVLVARRRSERSEGGRRLKSGRVGRRRGCDGVGAAEAVGAGGSRGGGQIGGYADGW